MICIVMTRVLQEGLIAYGLGVGGNGKDPEKLIPEKIPRTRCHIKPVRSRFLRMYIL